MKLLSVTAIKEDLLTVSLILKQSAIAVFSVAETVGHKTEDHDYLPDNWFGKDDEGANALLFFSFTEDEKATKVIELVKEHNQKMKTPFPIRAFISPVEQATY